MVEWKASVTHQIELDAWVDGYKDVVVGYCLPILEKAQVDAEILAKVALLKGRDEKDEEDDNVEVIEDMTSHVLDRPPSSEGLKEDPQVEATAVIDEVLTEVAEGLISEAAKTVLDGDGGKASQE